ncbi:hypothetical protein CLU79DRAFT_705511 [Phycomyces nitens]|nr:hypothetical protein CLU79DRAFT_705511 [Phycomyces nitens]
MSESSCSRPFQPLPRPHTAPRPSSTATEKAEDKKKIPQSRGRRVSNIPSNGTRMFTCSFVDCGKVFKRSEHLKRHIRSIHTLEKPFECPYHNCNKRFSRSDNLNQHIRIHRHSTSQVMHVKDKSSTTSANTMGQSNSNVERGHTFSNFVPNYI